MAIATVTKTITSIQERSTRRRQRAAQCLGATLEATVLSSSEGASEPKDQRFLAGYKKEKTK